jgi:hypothetical protein
MRCGSSSYLALRKDDSGMDHQGSITVQHDNVSWNHFDHAVSVVWCQGIALAAYSKHSKGLAENPRPGTYGVEGWL